MSTTSPIRIDDDLYAAAKTVGARMSRSAAQQSTHWARIGRELESATSVAHRDIDRVLAGEQDDDRLDARAQAIVRTAWSERLTAGRRDLPLEREFAAAGEPYAEADHQGRVVESAPSEQGRGCRPTRSCTCWSARTGQAGPPSPSGCSSRRPTCRP